MERRELLLKNGLKITPQRLAVLEALESLKRHPTAENILEFIKKIHPDIATGTIYKTLETFVDKGIIRKVKTERDIMRYDAIMEKHHHLYCVDSDRIEDFYDEELDKLLEAYFKKKNIQNFKIENVNLQIIGDFTDGRCNEEV